MRAGAVLSSAGRHFLVPKSVWTPAGGFWGSSGAPGADHQVNTLVGFLVFAATGLTVASVGSGLEVRRRARVGAGATRA